MKWLVLIGVLVAQEVVGQTPNGWYLFESYDFSNPLSNQEVLRNVSDSNFILSASHIATMHLKTSKTKPFNQLTIWFNPEGRDILLEATSKWQGNFFVLIVHEKVAAIVMITSEISNGQMSITGEKKELKNIRKNLGEI